MRFRHLLSEKETSDCIVSWSDSTGNSVGEGFLSQDSLQALTQLSTTQTDALTPKQSRCCLLQRLRTQATTTLQQRLKMGHACTAKDP